MRWTVPVPIPSDLATFKIPKPFASCFRTFRSVALSIFGLLPAVLNQVHCQPIGRLAKVHEHCSGTIRARFLPSEAGPLLVAPASSLANDVSFDHLVGAGEPCRWDPETYALARWSPHT